MQVETDLPDFFEFKKATANSKMPMSPENQSRNIDLINFNHTSLSK